MAHHIQTSDVDAIEFADGGKSIKEIETFFLQQKESVKYINLFLFVCNSSGLKEVVYELPLFEAVAAASWYVPLHEGVQFIYHWVSCLNNERTLTEAYHQAIKEFIN